MKDGTRRKTRIIGSVGGCLVLCLVAMTSAHAQAQPGRPQRRPAEGSRDLGNVADAINRVRQGDFLAVHVEEIVEAGAVEAIPALEQQFSRSIDPKHEDDLDPGNKGKIAS